MNQQENDENVYLEQGNDELVLSAVHLSPTNPSPYSRNLQTTIFSSIDHSINISINHKLGTTIELVGLQVWGGCLLLLDYLHNCNSVKGSCILEIGSGTGLASIYAALLGCTRVYSTDIDTSDADSSDGTSLFELQTLNIKANHIDNIVVVRELDLTDGSHPIYKSQSIETDSVSTESSDYKWTPIDLTDVAENCKLIIAADIIYDDSLTFQFVCRLPDLLVNGRQLILALEKRVNFTLEDMEARAHARDFLRHTLQALNADREEEKLAVVGFEVVDLETIPQVFEYERSQDLELYRFWL
ncbi:hypothetical protein SmJEL517_g04817 [Synchytrium microbalum]|uniref:FAM86 N-terminal domain-containing protein n=1 Tax=Synchytrium microbalum TaxID=1806994 RepID=A0A507C1N1_9FUNG|nr:uncharacterized protein SmJEL517_g04817 [Synchytrium microbalum]TPX31984.1 hypothetical protein SmJEL517_g04817 [Synchytrium microbalum]